MSDYNLLIESIENNTFKDTDISFQFGGITDEQVETLLQCISDKPELAKNITSINFEFCDLEDCVIDLSEFTELKTLALSSNKLKNPPLISTCTKLENIYLRQNNYQALPDLSNLFNLKFIDITHNPLSQSTIEKIEEITGRKRDGIVIRFTPIEVSGKFNLDELSQKNLEQLIELFAISVDKQDKTPSDLADIKLIATAFNDNISRLKNEKEDDEINQMLEKSVKDSLFHNKFKFMMKYCREFCPDAGAGGSKSFYFDNEENGLSHYTSDNVWLPDFSFLSQYDSVQFPIGKERPAEKKSPFPKGMLIPMGLSVWESDLQFHYLTSQEKKEFKIRETNDQFVLRRNVDEDHMPQGNYIYALSLNGGLIALEAGQGNAHSVMRAGQYVICAGHIEVDDHGKIVKINSHSGHMGPPEMNLLCATIYLFTKNYIDENCLIETYDNRLTLSVKDLVSNIDEYIVDEEILFFIKDMLLNTPNHENKTLLDEKTQQEQQAQTFQRRDRASPDMIFSSKAEQEKRDADSNNLESPDHLDPHP